MEGHFNLRIKRFVMVDASWLMAQGLGLRKDFKRIPERLFVKGFPERVLWVPNCPDRVFG